MGGAATLSDTHLIYLVWTDIEKILGNNKESLAEPIDVLIIQLAALAGTASCVLTYNRYKPSPSWRRTRRNRGGLCNLNIEREDKRRITRSSAGYEERIARPVPGEAEDIY